MYILYLGQQPRGARTRLLFPATGSGDSERASSRGAVVCGVNSDVFSMGRSNGCDMRATDKTMYNIRVTTSSLCLHFKEA